MADATALGAVGETLGGSNPLPPIELAGSRKGWRFESSLAHGLLENSERGGEPLDFPSDEGASWRARCVACDAGVAQW